MAEHFDQCTAGKWGRAVSTVGEKPTAPSSPSVDIIEIVSPAADVHNTAQNDNIVDLYSVGHEKVT